MWWRLKVSAFNVNMQGKEYGPMLVWRYVGFWMQPNIYQAHCNPNTYLHFWVSRNLDFKREYLN